MIDQTKRKTLKSVAAMGVGAATVSFNGLSMATSALEDVSQYGVADAITLEVNQGWSAQDLHIVLRNDSQTETTIHSMGTDKVDTLLGHINLDNVMETGPLRMAPNQTVQLHIVKPEDAPDNVSYSSDVLRAFQRSVSKQLVINTGGGTAAPIIRYLNLEWLPKINIEVNKRAIARLFIGVKTSSNDCFF